MYRPCTCFHDGILCSRSAGSRKTKRVVGYKNGEYVDFDINEALAMEKGISEYQYEVAKSLSANYSK